MNTYVGPPWVNILGHMQALDIGFILNEVQKILLWFDFWTVVCTYFSSCAMKFDYLVGAEWSWFKHKNNKQLTKLEYLLETLVGCWSHQVGCLADKHVFCCTELSTRTSYSPTKNVSPCLLWNGDTLNDRMDSLVPEAFALTSPLTFS
jgi:hypothetical protein